MAKHPGLFEQSTSQNYTLKVGMRRREQFSERTEFKCFMF